MERHRGQKIYPDVIGEKYKIEVKNFGRLRSDLPFPMSEYQARISKLKHLMKENNIEILLIRKPEDLRYLANFQTIGDSDNQTLIIDCSSAAPVFHCRLLEARLIEKQTWVSEWYSQLDCDDPLHTLKTILEKKFNYYNKQISIDHTAISASDLDKLETKLGCAVSNADDLLEKIRLVRTELEIKKIMSVSKITETGILAGIAAVKIGQLESSVFLASLNAMIAKGSEEPAYSPIVRTDEPAGHGTWEVGKQIKKGLVFLEMSANIHGHHAPMMRTCYILDNAKQKAPAWVFEAENLINSAFEKCLPLMKPGTRASLIDETARKTICSNSFGGTMVARSGYTAGGTASIPAGYAGWGDACFSFAGNNHQKLQENQSFHFIPWIQKIDGEEIGPIGLSDTIVVTNEGGKRISSLPLKIDILGPDGKKGDNQ